MEPAIIDRGRGPEIAGTRITVFDILDYLEAGWDDKGIAVVLNLGTAQVRAARHYIETHQEEVQAVARRIKERIAQGNPPEVRAKLAVAHAKLQSRLQQLRARRVEGQSDAKLDG
ncbi:MAG: DUF433 domain-containing protein [Isosphaeraceae bacterium]